MITYTYKCNSCESIEEFQQSIKDKPFTLCPHCNQNTFERIIDGGLAVFVGQDPKSLIQLAERNTKKMGHYELQERRHDEAVQKIESRNLAQQELAQKYGSTPVVYKEEDTKKSEKINKINRMTPEQKVKYIEKGVE